MKLTQTEFNKIRPFQWSLEYVGRKAYYTIRNETDARLFWIDFFYYVYADKFKSQNVITHITQFDLSQPVRLDTKEGELLLPGNLDVVDQVLKTINEHPFALPLNLLQSTLLIVAILFIILLYILFTPSKIKAVI